ncbi:MAG: hypothetical protein WC548_04415 [Candidatus Pacearchaeota archaeon]
MADIILIEKWVSSMEEAVSQLEKATEYGRRDEVNRLRMEIFILYQKIDSAISGKNV